SLALYLTQHARDLLDVYMPDAYLAALHRLDGWQRHGRPSKYSPEALVTGFVGDGDQAFVVVARDKRGDSPRARNCDPDGRVRNERARLVHLGRQFVGGARNVDAPDAQSRFFRDLRVIERADDARDPIDLRREAGDLRPPTPLARRYAARVPLERRDRVRQPLLVGHRSRVLRSEA